MVNAHVGWLQIGGLIQMAFVLVNAILPGKLRVRERMAGVPRYLWQVFVVHWIYIVLIVFFFGLLCFLFPGDLAGGSALGRFLSGAMAVFWFLRLLLQVFYYDAEMRRENRLLDFAYLVGLLALISIFGLAAFSGGAARRIS